MKNILYFIIVLFAFSSSVIAQDVPRVISYQGVLVDANGKPETRKNVSFSFTFYSDKTSGNVVVQKQSKVLDVIGGLFNTMLEIPPTADLNQQLWLEIEVEGKIFPNRIQMATALYALNIPDNVVTTNKIKDGTVTSNKIKDNAITNSKIAPNSVGSSQIISNSIETGHLQSACVTDGKIAYNAINTFHIEDNTVNSFDLSDNIVLGSLRLKKDGDESDLTNAYFGSLYSTVDGNYKGYGLAIFGKDGVEPNWNTGQSICGFSADGVVYGKSKAFIVTDPTDNSRKIQYTAIEGPEAAMYFRGEGKLVNEKSKIKLPAHFQALASDSGITVSLTPKSEKSLGLAVISVSNEEIIIQELYNGNGNYNFYYWITAIRKGYENYKVYLYEDDFSKPSPSFNLNQNINQNNNIEE